MRECQNLICRLTDRFLTIVLLLYFKIKTNTDVVSQKSGQTVSVLLTNVRLSKHPKNEVLLFSGLTENEEHSFRREDVTLGYGGLKLPHQAADISCLVRLYCTQLFFELDTNNNNH